MSMDSPVITYIPSKDKIVIDEGEVYRYLGYSMKQVLEWKSGKREEETESMVQEALRLTEQVMMPKACYCRCKIEMNSDGRIKFPYGETISHDLTKNLQNCKEIFLFASTIGTEFDRFLRRSRLESMVKAAFLQAAGAAAVESLCDLLNEELKKIVEEEGHKTHPRYSPGYGDYTLENQKGIFAVLQPARYIGLSLMDTLVMAPEKSVTAVIGIE